MPTCTCSMCGQKFKVDEEDDQRNEICPHCGEAGVITKFDDDDWELTEP